MSDETQNNVPATPAINPADFETLKESVAKLEAKNRELLEEKAKAKQAAEQAALEAAKKSGDLESLESSWKQKLESTTGEYSGRIKELESMLTRITSGAEAKKLASDLAMPGHADLLMPHIERRLTTEVRDGVPQVRILDANGHLSAMTIEDLRKEIANSPLFAPILAGSRASGGGAPTNGSNSIATKKFTEYSSGELVALRRENPSEYERIKKAHYGA